MFCFHESDITQKKKTILVSSQDQQSHLLCWFMRFDEVLHQKFSAPWALWRWAAFPKEPGQFLGHLSNHLFQSMDVHPLEILWLPIPRSQNWKCLTCPQVTWCHLCCNIRTLQKKKLGGCICSIFPGACHPACFSSRIQRLISPPESWLVNGNSISLLWRQSFCGAVHSFSSLPHRHPMSDSSLRWLPGRDIIETSVQDWVTGHLNLQIAEDGEICMSLANKKAHLKRHFRKFIYIIYMVTAPSRAYLF